MSNASVVQSECRAYLATLAPNSLDSCVTDPPYELNFMGRGWDRSGIANQVELWRAVYRVLKPGAHLVAFGGTRTAHRMVCAIEDAGFEIRDSLQWLYGSGFPKSLDVSKALDKAAGAERAVVGPKMRPDGKRMIDARPNGFDGSHEGWDRPWKHDRMAIERQASITAPATDLAAQWQGWGTALKPAHEPIVLARKPLAGTVAATVAAYGTGGINVEACRVATTEIVPADRPGGSMGYNGNGKGHIRHNGDGTDNLVGRWPTNVLLTHSAACKLVGTRRVRGTKERGLTATPARSWANKSKAGINRTGHADPDGTETVPAWECAPDCPVAALDGQSGQSSDRVTGYDWASSNNDNTVHVMHNIKRGVHYGDTGGASRFYPILNYDPAYDDPFLYCAKASRKERNAGCAGLPERVAGNVNQFMDGTRSNWIEDARHPDGGYAMAPPQANANHHPTVKPVALCRWLVRLVTPIGGMVLDPFAGSGSVGVACILEDRRYAGCDQDAEYVDIANRRIAATQPALLGV